MKLDKNSITFPNSKVAQCRKFSFERERIGLSSDCWELRQSQRRNRNSNIFIASMFRLEFTHLRQTTKTRPSATTSNEEREQKISNRMVGNRILHTLRKIRSLRPQNLDRCARHMNENNRQTKDAGKASRSASYHEKKKQILYIPTKQRKFYVCDFRHLQ